MIFRKSDSTAAVEAYIFERFEEHLKNGEVCVWLLSGGSAIPVAVSVARRLRSTFSPLDLHKLHVSLSDERFGPVGQVDSNWQQLLVAGFLLSGAELLPVLTGKSFDDTTADFDALLSTQLIPANYTLGLFGMGPDGHTAGIKPGSPALEASRLATCYVGDDYQRITMSAKAIGLLDEAVLYATGAGKWPMLEKLQATLPAVVQPAQLLKTAAHLTIFNDLKGDSV